MNVRTAAPPAQGENRTKYFTTDTDNSITFQCLRKGARETGAGVFSAEEQLVEVWNSITGGRPVTSSRAGRTAEQFR